MGEVSRQNRGCEFNQTWASQERLSVQILPREAPSNWHEPRRGGRPRPPSRAKLDRFVRGKNSGASLRWADEDICPRWFVATLPRDQETSAAGQSQLPVPV